MIFTSPWFALLLPLPLLVRFIFPPLKRNETDVNLYFPALNRLKAAFSCTLPKSSHWITTTLLSLSWCFFILALMQPEKVDQFTQSTSQGHDLLLAVDVSASMQAVDFSTAIRTMTRLDVTKEVVGKFIGERTGDRLGLIVFGEYAYLYVPLTLDGLSVSHMLDATLPGMAGNATAIGDAIATAVRTLRDRPEGSRVLVLLTDGEDNASNIAPLEAAKLAKKYGIKIYTIGIGQKGSVPFPTNLGYQMVTVTMDEKLLKEIAEMTDGRFFAATDKRGLEAIYKEIDNLEKTESNDSVFYIREPLYRYPLTIAALVFLAALFWQIPYNRFVNGY